MWNFLVHLPLTSPPTTAVALACKKFLIQLLPFCLNKMPILIHLRTSPFGIVIFSLLPHWGFARVTHWTDSTPFFVAELRSSPLSLTVERLRTLVEWLRTSFEWVSHSETMNYVTLIWNESIATSYLFRYTHFVPLLFPRLSWLNCLSSPINSWIQGSGNGWSGILLRRAIKAQRGQICKAITY